MHISSPPAMPPVNTCKEACISCYANEVTFDRQHGPVLRYQLGWILLGDVSLPVASAERMRVLARRRRACVRPSRR